MYIMLLLLLACQVDTLEKSELEEMFENQWWMTDQEVVEDFYETESDICFMFYNEEFYEGNKDGIVFTYFFDSESGDRLTEYIVSDSTYEFVEYEGVKMQVASTEDGYEAIFSQGLLRKKVNLYTCSI